MPDALVQVPELQRVIPFGTVAYTPAPPAVDPDTGETVEGDDDNVTISATAQIPTDLATGVRWAMFYRFEANVLEKNARSFFSLDFRLLHTSVDGERTNTIVIGADYGWANFDQTYPLINVPSPPALPPGTPPPDPDDPVYQPRRPFPNVDSTYTEIWNFDGGYANRFISVAPIALKLAVSSTGPYYAIAGPDWPFVLTTRLGQKGDDLLGTGEFFVQDEGFFFDVTDATPAPSQVQVEVYDQNFSSLDAFDVEAFELVLVAFQSVAGSIVAGSYDSGVVRRGVA